MHKKIMDDERGAGRERAGKKGRRGGRKEGRKEKRKEGEKEGKKKGEMVQGENRRCNRRRQVASTGGGKMEQSRINGVLIAKRKEAGVDKIGEQG